MAVLLQAPKITLFFKKYLEKSNNKTKKLNAKISIESRTLTSSLLLRIREMNSRVAKTRQVKAILFCLLKLELIKQEKQFINFQKFNTT